MSAVDLTLSFPSDGLIRLRSRSLFGDVEGPTCRRFLDRIFQASEIAGVTVRGGRSPHADFRFCPETSHPHEVVERIIALLREGTDGPAPPPARRIATARDRRGTVRYFRHAGAMTGWEIRRDEPGRMLLKNRVLFRQSSLCQAVERELGSVLGIESYRAGALTGTVRVEYDPAQLDARDVIAILDAALEGAGPAGPPDPMDLHLPLCTASVPIAAAAQLAVPALLPAAAALFAYTSLPTLRGAYRTLVRERRIGSDVLDSAVVIGCLGTMSILPGAVLCWGLGIGRALTDRTRDSSRKLLLDAFGQRPHRARLCDDDSERPIPADRLRKGDLVVVDAGEVVPADGRIVAGRAMIDPHALPAGSSPSAKAVGDRVLAATLVMGGRVYVAVEAAGVETISARIGRILREAAEHRPAPQRQAERLAERLAIPTLALGAFGMAAMGPAVGLAVLNRDFASGLRMAAPPAMLGALALCAHRGILIRDARALDRLAAVDAVLLDASALSPAEHDEVPEWIDRLRDRGIVHVDILPSAGADAVASRQADGRTVCLIGDGLDGSPAMRLADVSISLRGPSTIADDAAGVVFLEEGLSKLGDLIDTARDLDRNLRRGRAIILAPNLACVAGVFTMGLGLLASVAINNAAALLALVQAVWPLREVAELEAERRHRLQLARMAAARPAFSAESADSARSGQVSGPVELASPWPGAYHGEGSNGEPDATLAGGCVVPPVSAR